jgi:DNA-binding GntR family transcriptional regulator
MRKSKGRIRYEVLEEIFPKKLKRSVALEWTYTELKQMILSGKLKKGERLFREKIAQDFNISEAVVALACSRLKKDGLIIIKGGIGSFVA